MTLNKKLIRDPTLDFKAVSKQKILQVLPIIYDLKGLEKKSCSIPISKAVCRKPP